MSYGFNTIASKTNGGLAKSPSFKRIIALIDMDNFFASCEEACNPEFKKYPLIICGRFERGVVTTANRIAKINYGIKVGMSGGEARRLCPDGIFKVGDLDKYIYFSKQINQIVRQFTDTIEPYSVDELFLDLTGCPESSKPYHLGLKIKQSIASELKLPATIGFGPNRFIAKMACHLGKPDGIFILNEKSYRHFFWPKSLINLWGIGRKGEKSLNKLGIETVEQLAHYPCHALKKIYGIRGQWYHDMAWGKDTSQVGSYNDEPNMSYGHSYILKKDSSDTDLIMAILFRLCDKCTFRMRRDGIKARIFHVSIETKYGYWLNHQVTVDQPSHCDVTVFKICRGIYHSYQLSEPVRRIAMRANQLIEASHEIDMPLFEPFNEVKERKLLHTLDQIRWRYGDKSLMRGRSLIDFKTLKAIHFQTARRFQSQNQL